MSKIQLTLTDEHYDKRVAHEEGWIDEDDPEVTLRLYYLFHPLTLEFDVPSPWRTDVKNAPRDESEILIKDFNGSLWLVYWDGYGWSDGHEAFKDSEIAYWMEIPKLPKL